MNDPKIIEALLRDAPDLMTVDEVAAIMRVNPSTVIRWMRDWKLQGISVGARLNRFRKSDVADFLLRADEEADD